MIKHGVVIRMEEWKVIDGFGGFYEVSNHGNIRRVKTTDAEGKLLREKQLKVHLYNWYLNVGLYNRRTKRSNYFRVDKLVAKAFIPNTFNLRFIYHKDGNVANSRVDNLEWCDYNRDLQRRRQYGTAIR